MAAAGGKAQPVMEIVALRLFIDARLDHRAGSLDSLWLLRCLICCDEIVSN
jgi:hypothetical protein